MKEVLKWTAGVLAGIVIGLAVPKLNEVLNPPKPFSTFEVVLEPTRNSKANPATALQLTVLNEGIELKSLTLRSSDWNGPNRIIPLSLDAAQWIPFHNCSSLVFRLESNDSDDGLAGQIRVNGRTADGGEHPLVNYAVVLGVTYGASTRQEFTVDRLRCT